MRILSARISGMTLDRIHHRVHANVVLHLAGAGGERIITIATAAPVHAPGVGLKSRLIASAKLRLAARLDMTLPEAEAGRPAA